MGNDSLALPVHRSLAMHVALALVAAKLAWAFLLLHVGDYDFRHAHGDDVLRVVATLVNTPIHLVLAGFLWRGRKWAASALIVIAIAGALGAGGSGLFFGLPHALDGNYDRDTAMVPFEAVAIAINVALALSLWRARRALRPASETDS